MSILCQSPDPPFWHRSCQSYAYRRTKAALNLGTSLLLGPTNSLNGGWFRTKYYPTTSPIHCHNVNPAPIRVGSPTYLMEQVLQGTIRSVSTEDDSDNPFPMRCHSSANPFLILDQCVNPRPICQSNVNPGLIRQSIANTDAMCSTDQAPDPLQLPQYSANLPIQCQSSVNPWPILHLCISKYDTQLFPIGNHCQPTHRWPIHQSIPNPPIMNLSANLRPLRTSTKTGLRPIDSELARIGTCDGNPLSIGRPKPPVT